MAEGNARSLHLRLVALLLRAAVGMTENNSSYESVKPET